MGSTAIVDAVIQRLNEFSPDEQQETLDFVETLTRRRDSERLKAAQIEAQAILNGPFHTMEESRTAFREKFNVPDLSHLSDEEMQARLDAEFATFSPEKIAELERLGLL